jgi:hypothetical protein
MQMIRVHATRIEQGRHKQHKTHADEPINSTTTYTRGIVRVRARAKAAAESKQRARARARGEDEGNAAAAPMQKSPSFKQHPPPKTYSRPNSRTNNGLQRPGRRGVVALASCERMKGAAPFSTKKMGCLF